jgi:hypothetical protein
MRGLTVRGRDRVRPLGLAIIAVLVGASAAASGPACEEGVVDLTLISVGVGVGGVWGEGTIRFADEVLALSVWGIQLADVGVAKSRFRGRACRGRERGTLDGVYVLGEAGLVLGGGASALGGENQARSRLRLSSRALGLRIRLGPAGWSVDVH